MVLASLVLTAAIATTVAPAAKHTPEECAVWDREVSFSKSMERKDQKAVAAHIYSEGVFSSETSGAFVGPNEISKALWVEYVDSPAIVRWRPVTVSIGRNQDHAIVTGVRVFEDLGLDVDGGARFMTWTFRHIWRRDPRSKEWKIEFDGSQGEIESRGSRAELNDELARAPKTCPR